METYKIIRICAAEPHIDFFYNYYERNHLSDLTYNEALRKLQEYGFLVPGSWSVCMQQLGNESTDIIVDFMPMQKHWAEENGSIIDFTRSDWSIQSLFAQIKTIKPNIILFYAGGVHTIPADTRRRLKDTFPFIKIVAGFWTDELKGGYTVFRDMDILFCAYRSVIDRAKSAGVKACLVRNCFDHILGKIVEGGEISTPINDFIFAGHSGYLFNDKRGRYLDLIKLMNNSTMKIWCWEPGERLYLKRKLERLMRNMKDTAVGVLSKLNEEHINKLRIFMNTQGEETRVSRLFEDAVRKRKGLERCNWWHDKRSFFELYPSRCFSPVFGIDYYRLFKSSKIVFNRHTEDITYCGNYRMFEVTGMGACLLTDRRKGAMSFFMPDDEIVTYDSIEECIEKVNYLLSHEEVRYRIAAAGRRRTLRDHTVMNRCQEIDETLRKML